jgi:hypothetical protein
LSFIILKHEEYTLLTLLKGFDLDYSENVKKTKRFVSFLILKSNFKEVEIKKKEKTRR